MKFGEALELVKQGASVRREGWREPRNWEVFLKQPSEGSDVEWPYLVKKWTDGTVAWMPTHADLLAEDWEKTEK